MVTRWIKMAGEKVHFQGLPCRICWLEYGERAKAGEIFNDLVRTGKVKAPIVIGRDHLDSGSVASPYRETESMMDGSDAIADWPILNALLNTAAGASWVSFHHGGGVGIGKSLHAGMVVVADGTDMMGERLRRVLTTDPGTGVMRHADAGYPEAIEKAKESGIDLPMVEARLMDGLVQLDLELCKACGVCIELCPDKVFDRDKLGFPVLAREEACRQCLLCELHCPDFAIEVRRRERKATASRPTKARAAHADADATPALTRDDLIAAAAAARPDDGCAHNGEEG